MLGTRQLNPLVESEMVKKYSTHYLLFEQNGTIIYIDHSSWEWILNGTNSSSNLFDRATQLLFKFLLEWLILIKHRNIFSWKNVLWKKKKDIYILLLKNMVPEIILKCKDIKVVNPTQLSLFDVTSRGVNTENIQISKLFKHHKDLLLTFFIRLNWFILFFCQQSNFWGSAHMKKSAHLTLDEIVKSFVPVWRSGLR